MGCEHAFRLAMPRLSPLTNLALIKWALLGAGVVLATVAWSWKDHQDTLALAAVQQANLAQLLENHAFHVISNADAVLDRVRDEVRDHDTMGKGADRRWPMMGQMASKLPVSGRLWLYRADGSAVMASHLRHSTNNANDRAYFTAQKTADAGLYIGETVVGKTTGKKVFNLSRRITAPDGSFAGVVMAAIDIDVFTQAVNKLKLGQSAAFLLIRNDGAIIMRHPDDGVTGTRINLQAYGWPPGGTESPEGLIQTTATVDGQERQLAYRIHPTLPLTTVVSLSRTEVLAPWRHRALMLGAGLTLLLLVTGWLSVAAHNAAQREQRAVRRMQKVLDTVGEGLCELDEHGRIIYINPTGAQLLGHPPQALAGKPFQHAAQTPVDPMATLHQRSQDSNHAGSDVFSTQDGRTFAAQYTATSVDDLDGHPGVVMAFRDVSAVVAAQNALRDQKEFVTTILDSLSEHIAVVDAQGVVTAVNAAWRGFASANGAANAKQVSVGANYLAVCAKAADTANARDAANALAGIRAVLAGELPAFSLEYPCHGPHAQLWFVQHALPLQGKQGAVIIHQNITARHQAEAVLRDNEARYRLLSENMADIVWMTDANLCFTYLNSADQRLRGFELDAVLGRPIMDTLTPQGQTILANALHQRQQLSDNATRGQPLRVELPQRCHDGGEVWTDITAIPMHDTSGQFCGFQGIGRDVTARKRADNQRQQEQLQLQTRLTQAAERQRSLQELANCDPLTGIYNRRYFNEVMPQELLKAGREGHAVAVIMLDLDHFKRINDTHGHAAGDEVLKALATFLKRRAREGDIICRHGGEEFVVAMPHMPIERACERIESWRTELANLCITHGSTQMHVTFSAGLSAYPVHGTNLDTLLTRADDMLYRSKNEGRNRITVYGQ